MIRKLHLLKEVAIAGVLGMDLVREHDVDLYTIIVDASNGPSLVDLFLFTGVMPR